MKTLPFQLFLMLLVALVSGYFAGAALRDDTVMSAPENSAEEQQGEAHAALNLITARLTSSLPQQTKSDPLAMVFGGLDKAHHVAIKRRILSSSSSSIDSETKMARCLNIEFCELECKKVRTGRQARRGIREETNVACIAWIESYRINY